MSEVAEHSAEGSNCRVVELPRRELIASQDVEKDLISVCLGEWQIDFQELIQRIVNQRGVVGLGPLRGVVRYAIRRSKCNVQSANLGVQPSQEYRASTLTVPSG